MSHKISPEERERLRKPQIDIMFGSGGHEDEYVITNRPDGAYGGAKEIPGGWERVFEERLGKEWSVMDRGSRLEIKPPIVGDKRNLRSQRQRTAQTDEAIQAIFQSLVEEKIEIKFFPKL